MDNPRQYAIESNYPEEGKLLKYEIFDPPFDRNQKEMQKTAKFTVGKQYPIYEEKYPPYLANINDVNAWMRGIVFRPLNDDNEMVFVDSIYFHYEADVWSNQKDAEDSSLFDLRAEYKTLKNHTPFEEYMALFPVWRKLADLPESLNLTSNLKELDEELNELKICASMLQSRIQDKLRRQTK
jgi:hypothetical protein